MVSRRSAFTGSPDAGKQGGFGDVFPRGGEAPVQLGRLLRQTFDRTLGTHPIDERSKKQYAEVSFRSAWPVQVPKGGEVVMGCTLAKLTVCWGSIGERMPIRMVRAIHLDRSEAIDRAEV